MATDELWEDLEAEVRATKARQDDQERSIQKQQERLDKLGEQFDEIAEIIGAKGPAFLLSPWWWPDLNRDEAKEAWEILKKFVDEIVIGIYEDAGPPVQGELAEGDEIQKCWFAHPIVVQKLSSLLWAQKNDYRRHAPAHGPHEFLHVLVPRTLEQIKLFDCQGGCAKLDGKKSRDLTWDDRENWIRDKDLAHRPIAMPNS